MKKLLYLLLLLPVGSWAQVLQDYNTYGAYNIGVFKRGLRPPVYTTLPANPDLLNYTGQSEGGSFAYTTNGKMWYWNHNTSTWVELSIGSISLSDFYTKTNLQTPGQALVHWNNITNTPSFLTTETDPVFTASPAAGIAGSSITSWNTVTQPANQIAIGSGTGLTSYSTFTRNPANGEIAITGVGATSGATFSLRPNTGNWFDFFGNYVNFTAAAELKLSAPKLSFFTTAGHQQTVFYQDGQPAISIGDNNGGRRIGVNTLSPNASAQLDVNSTTRGILPPRLTTAQLNSVATPADGLFLWNSDSARFVGRTSMGYKYIAWVGEGGSGSVGGSNSQLQYNNAGALGGANIGYSLNSGQPQLMWGTDGGYIYNGAWGGGNAYIIRGGSTYSNISLWTSGTIRFQNASNSPYATFASTDVAIANLRTTNTLSIPSGASTGINFAGPSFTIGYGQYTNGTLLLKTNSTGASINASAQVELSSDSKAFLPTRHTTIQWDAIATKATALTTYDTDKRAPVYYDGTNTIVQVGMIYGSAAPATAPPAINLLFLDTINKKLYVAAGTASSTDWIILN